MEEPDSSDEEENPLTQGRGTTRCCICSTEYQNCKNCKCTKLGIRCTNCRKGPDCQNRAMGQGAAGRNVQRKNIRAQHHVGEAGPSGFRGERERHRAIERQGDQVRNQQDGQMPQGHEVDEAPLLMQTLEARDDGDGPNNSEPEDGQAHGQQQGEQAQERPRADGIGEGQPVWKGLRGIQLGNWVDNTYKEIMGWPVNNMFVPPVCAATGEIIEEMTRLIQNYVRDTELAPHALKIMFIMPKLFFQKTYRNSSNREDKEALFRRVEWWKKNELDEVLEEARASREGIKPTKRKQNGREDRARRFGDLMRTGKVAPAIRSITKEGTDGLLAITEETKKLLEEKHPEPSEREGLRFRGEFRRPNPVIYECINGEMIRKKANSTKGSAGPSGLDAEGWRTILSVAKFNNKAADLGKALATLARKLASKECQHIEAYTASRLVPLNKNPGVRPVGIGEVVRRIIGKCIMEVVNDDIRKAAGNLQVCAGHQAGGEAAVHAIREIYEEEECEAVLLVDATNAFNTLHRKTTIHNIKIKCPSFATYIENTYKQPADLFIMGQGEETGHSLKSREGTTQGDPVAMAMYSIGLTPLQNETNLENTGVRQVAYADDLTGAGKVSDLKQWWDKVTELGPEVGYFPNARKFILIVKPAHYENAITVFGESEVVVTCEGQRHLGAVIGTEEFKKDYITGKVKEWIEEVEKLATIAKTEPQPAYAAFVHGVKHRWNYIMRTVPGVSELLQPLEDCIRDKLIPEWIKNIWLNATERDFLTLPTRLGGLGLINPVKRAEEEHQNSMRITRSLVDFIKAQDSDGEVDQREFQNIRKTISRERENSQKLEKKQIMTCFQRQGGDLPRRIQAACETGASNWLTALPIKAKGFNLNKEEFKDALALRYGLPIEGLPDRCTCGTENDADHTMICKKGGFISIRHDEIRDLTTNMLKEVCREVTHEPRLIALTGEVLQYRTANTADEARLDISARGFWRRGQRAFLT